ncbi:phosphate metabolism protein 7 [Mycoemilia scoparia]|uniref:Phosphate metabolism protein 7 n=1 Tax=Mycoemilia scoparia TaxID=417184 RepID=A0A9W7ZN76_9FUNG|nr:phosphate metabolism protein 7 [Mycoemilia scoparia]
MADDNVGTDPSQTTNASVSTFLWALLLNGLIGAGIFTVFLILRPYFPKVYSPRSKLPIKARRPPPATTTATANKIKSLFAWFRPTVMLSNEKFLQSCGPDALIMTRFLSHNCVLFICMAIISMGIILPINITTNDGTGAVQLDIWTMGNISSTSPRLWAHCIITFLFTLVVLAYIFYDAMWYVDLRREYLLSPQHRKLARTYTMLVLGIPKGQDSEEAVKERFNHLPGGVRSVYLCRGSKVLEDTRGERDKCRGKLESAMTKLTITYNKLERKNKVEKMEKVKRPTQRTGFLGLIGKKVDSIEYNSQEIASLNQKLREAKETYPEQSFDNAAFVVFNKQIAAHMAMKDKKNHKTVSLSTIDPNKSFQPRYVDVEPQSIIWSNLSINSLSRKIRRVLSLSVTSSIIILWAIPVAFVSSVAQLSNLSKLKPFESINSWPKTVTGIIQGILPAVALAVLNMVLIIVLRLLAKLEGVIRPEDIELSLINRVFSHQVFNTFLIVTISGTVISSLSTFIQDPVESVKEIAQKIPRVNVFFITYVLLLGLSGATKSLAQLVGVVLSKVMYRIFSWTPRQTLEKTKAQKFDYGTGLPSHSLVFLLGIVYSAVAPLMTVICAFYFGIYWIVYRYQFLYVYNDALFRIGGRTGPKYLAHRFVSLYFFLILMLIQMSLSTSQSSTASSIIRIVLMGIALGLVFASNLWMRFRVYPKFDLLPLCESTDGEVGSEFGFAGPHPSDTTDSPVAGVEHVGDDQVPGSPTSQQQVFSSETMENNDNEGLISGKPVDGVDGTAAGRAEGVAEVGRARAIKNYVSKAAVLPNYAASRFGLKRLFSKQRIIKYMFTPPAKETAYPESFVSVDDLLPQTGNGDLTTAFPHNLADYPHEIDETDTLIINTNDGYHKSLTASFRPPGFSNPAFTFVWVPKDPTRAQKMKELHEEAQENLGSDGKVVAEGAIIEESSGKVKVIVDHEPEYDERNDNISSNDNSQVVTNNNDNNDDALLPSYDFDGNNPFISNEKDNTNIKKN